MNVFAAIEALVRQSLNHLATEGSMPAGLDLSAVSVETPRDPSHGDLSTNAAMVLAKAARMKPRDIADKLVAKLTADSRITAAEIAGPGFINIRLDPETWRGQIRQILTEAGEFGRSGAGDATPRSHRPAKR